MHRFLVLSHRYLGIAICLLFMLWFASGFIIIYTGGMPSLTESARLTRQAPLDLASVRLSPQQAKNISFSDAIPRLLTIMGRPAYQFPGQRYRTVFADDGTLLSADMISSRQIVAEYSAADEDSIERIGRLENVDQWTIGLRGLLPLEKYSVNDGSGTEVYVSPQKGQVVLSTTDADRLLAWLGAIPHWLYFVELRKRSALWSDTVIWLASLGTILGLLGMVLLFTQLRKSTPFRWRDAIPYQGLMRWHYLCGLMFGLVTLTWVFSGLLSMEPYAWNSAQGLNISREVVQGGELDLLEFYAIANNSQRLTNAAEPASIKEIEFKRLQGRHYYQLTVTSSTSDWGFDRLLLQADDFRTRREPFSDEYAVEQLSRAVSDYQIVAEDILSSYDNYYYARASTAGPVAPLPVLRVKYNDPARTWYYVDLNNGELVYQSHRWGRVERWLYHGLHSLDFGFFYRSRPLWDVVVILLLLGGLALCGIACILGGRRLVRNSKQMLKTK